jgi:hypothetical protein
MSQDSGKPCELLEAEAKQQQHERERSRHVVPFLQRSNITWPVKTYIPIASRYERQ